MNQTFEDWYNELEFSGFRSERAIEDLTNNPSLKTITDWLEAAWNAGWDAGHSYEE